jgi:predicted pyridoxine 5'-phosphate oxidase superfamily flavin-nucleotide-binding protein
MRSIYSNYRNNQLLTTNIAFLKEMTSLWATDFEGSHMTIQTINNSELVFPPSARREQAKRGSARGYERKIASGFPDRITPELAAFIAELDTAFLGTASAAGAPYVQHRGGPKGFIKVLDERTLGFADYAGNRQYITLGNLAENDRAYLFLLDFAGRQRIKVWGRARVVEDDPALLERLVDPGYRARPERAILFTVAAWDVNCSQHITARFSEAEIADATALLRNRIADLETENARLRAASTLVSRVTLASE